MTCTKAFALRQAMREMWTLPKEEDLRKSGDEWALNILNSQPKEMRSKLLFMWWRAWHLRNDAIFGKGDASIRVQLASFSTTGTLPPK